VVTHYLEETRGKTLTIEEHRLRLFAILQKIGKPVFLAALTTLAGFASFCFTPIFPMREFGIISTELWGLCRVSTPIANRKRCVKPAGGSNVNALYKSEAMRKPVGGRQRVAEKGRNA
jgi:hypothetical protein